MSEEVYPINIWINEERFEKIRVAGLAELTKDVLAGLRVIQVPTTIAQKDALLALYPKAKCDTATTKTIELLPREVKDQLLDLALERRNVNVAGLFLEKLEAKK
jgi:hypothetical protein